MSSMFVSTITESERAELASRRAALQLATVAYNEAHTVYCGSDDGDVPGVGGEAECDALLALEDTKRAASDAYYALHDLIADRDRVNRKAISAAARQGVS